MNERVLVLNRSWVPINVVDALEAVSKVCKGRAKFLDPETYGLFDFEAWVETWDDAVRTAKVADGQRLVRAGHRSFFLPEVIVCTEYRGFGFKITHRKPKFSRRNLFLRDRNTCQFCGKKFQTEKLTLDHVVPKSKGGKVTWTNVVLACEPCNGKKGDKTLKEAGLALIRRPFEPRPEDLRGSPAERLRSRLGRGGDVPKSWEAFLGKMYWDVQLDQE